MSSNTKVAAGKQPSAAATSSAAPLQGGAKLWARLDAIIIDQPLPYPSQPVIEEMDMDFEA